MPSRDRPYVLQRDKCRVVGGQRVKLRRKPTVSLEGHNEAARYAVMVSAYATTAEGVAGERSPWAVI